MKRERARDRERERHLLGLPSTAGSLRERKGRDRTGPVLVRRLGERRSREEMHR